MTRIDDLLKKRLVRETTIKIVEIEEDEEDVVDNEAVKEAVKRELTALDSRVAMLEEELNLLRRD